MTTFRLARDCDDRLVRSLLRANEMSGWADITIEREPSFFDGVDWVGREWAALGQDGSDIVGMYTAAMRPTHINGRPEWIGYLGGLRVDRRHRNRVRHLRAGYASIEALAPVKGTRPWWFTVIGQENAAARRLLEGRVPGLPRYDFQGDYQTLVIPTARGRRLGMWRRAREGEETIISTFHNGEAARCHYSPVLDAKTVERVGIERFLVHERWGAIQGVVALWDQRSFKQVIVQRYRRPLGTLLPAYNLYARLARQLQFPSPGNALAQTFLAFFALAEEVQPELVDFLADALAQCRTPAATLGMRAQHPQIDALGTFKPVRYPARIYAVGIDGPSDLDGRPVQPEAALL